jgi:hypothetical protein
MSIQLNKNRIGNISSSQIYRLMGSKKPKETYLTELSYARRLGRSLTNETTSKPTSWGLLLEGIAFNRLGFEYSLVSDETIRHPEFDYWVGSPDGYTNDSVIDIKCPFTLKSFVELVDIQDIDTFKYDCPEYYWQLVSNAILLDKQFAELIVYCPYEDDLGLIKHQAQNVDAQDLYKYYWLGSATNEELPYLIPGEEFKDLNIFKFEVPQEDKDLLTETIKQIKL